MSALIATVEMTILVLLAAILAGPILGAKLRVPGLLALIFLGMIFGPFGVGWLGRVDLVFDLGAIGILYLMFLAGLGFNLKAFNENRTSALGFGILSFVFPFAFSVIAGQAYFETGILAALLLGSMSASNTLVAYPDVRAAGLEQTRAVRDAMSGGVVADVLALLVLAVATSYAVVEAIDPDSTVGAAPDLPLWLSIPLVVGFALWVLPRVGEWFFVRVGRSRMQRLLFALAAMAAAATLAELGGIASIIGAFLAGIGLNRLVPKNSELMERIDFVGSSVFVPAFLVSIGLRIDPAALVDPRTLLMALVFVGLVLVGKGLAVVLASVLFSYSSAERGLIGSLSIGQAARLWRLDRSAWSSDSSSSGWSTPRSSRSSSPPCGPASRRSTSSRRCPRRRHRARRWGSGCWWTCGRTPRMPVPSSTSPEGSRAGTTAWRSRSWWPHVRARPPRGAASSRPSGPPRRAAMTARVSCACRSRSLTGLSSWPRRRMRPWSCWGGRGRARARATSSGASWTASAPAPRSRRSRCTSPRRGTGCWSSLARVASPGTGRTRGSRWTSPAAWRPGPMSR